MKSRITDKIKGVEQYLRELDSFLPSSFQLYKNDVKTKAACEREFEKIIEAIIDINLLIIKFKKFEIPDDDNATFRILYEHKIIPETIMKNLMDAKGMRNFIVHQYGKVDDQVVFEALEHNVSKDVREFIKQIKKSLGL